ncbi:NPCBM/NEW2 domain-containing protein [Crossiella sp. SN42]|uniref:NPCBM/NEW2 domain-containing protein n=1 Tax=Crossiella sp. SN42 TaxID=2944808 RepID=UPI00207CE288|nr:NPCBM/NEW2 domain-containing protein [Crossiella sp. SN42]MCO1581504.1 NPCBM/NEW2 domain-containing protein [Crossiella sp. SN42]
MNRLARKLIASIGAAGAVLGLLVALPQQAAALPDGLALTPPMGFNNWNATGCAVDEKLIRDTADLFISKGLKDSGYEYVNIDDCWAAPDRDPVTKRLTHHPERFPSGIKALADYVHAKGLKLGIYTSAGTLTCAKTMPGALDHEEIDAQTFADWGVDYLKYDNCNNQGRPALERYTKMGDALKKTGRKIVYSLCEWGENKPWEWGAEVGHLWRTTGDITDTWAKTMDIMKRNAVLAEHAGPGRWNDPDMLEVGNGGMTDTEYRSHFSLWSIMAAPLLIGSDLRKVTPATFDILNNREIIAVDQDKLGKQGRVLSNQDGRWIFAKPLANGDTAVALFNETEVAARISTSATELGLPKRAGYKARDLWQHKDLQTAGEVSAVVPPHATVMYRISTGADWSWQQPAVTTGLDLATTIPGIPANLTPAGRTFEVGVSATNLARTPVFDPELTLTVPPKWHARLVRTDRRWLLRTGETVRAVYEVTVPATTPDGPAKLHNGLEFAWAGARKVTLGGEQQLIVPPMVPGTVSSLGDVRSAVEHGGYGPVERDMSNGSYRPGDGKPLTINGKRFAKGLGGHAPSTLTYYLNNRCTNLTTTVGIDDERDERQLGSATFEIWADGRKVADSGLRTWRDDAVTLSADLTGARYLKLVITDGGDGVQFDRGDFAEPLLTCHL